jgi:nucleotide-binding universal stress UspA family protein
VSDELIRHATVPLLLLPPGAATSGVFAEPAIKNVLVPLDGSPLAERVLEPALDLAQAMETSCTLVRVIGPQASEDERVEAEAYLTRIAERLEERCLPIQTRAIAAANPAEAILRLLPQDAGTVVAMATHGRGGLKRLVLGSVADKILRSSTTPMLVCRPVE